MRIAWRGRGREPLPRDMQHRSVSLVCMPWHFLGSPSIQLGTLDSVLARASIPCRSHSLYLEFVRWLEEIEAEAGALDIEDYGELAGRWMNIGAGEWVFGVQEIRKPSTEKDARFLDLCRANGMARELVGKLQRTRELVPRFLERCADEILSTEPAIVGFTSVYSQTIPSAALARVLRSRAPDLKIVFGGASCEGPMGPAILEAFADIDVVVRGEAESILPDLAASLLAKEPVPRRPGLCIREDGRILEIPADESSRVPMDQVPVPVFDEYFERLERLELAHQILPQIPFETARGCWWGMKAHCTFCGLNGTSMAFRSKSPERVLEEVSSLSLRHGVLDFTCTDNILDTRYFDSLLPALAERGADLGFFFETKANLTEPQVKALRSAGIRAIQPGIESLSTPTLKLMKKGVSALQNIRLLKWCAQHGIRVVWNLLYGFPGEAVEEYARMAELVPSLVHLQPPTLSALMVYRFSPYHDRPLEHGIELGDPLPFYDLLYDVGHESLNDLAQAFEYRHLDGRDPEQYVGALRAGVEQWNRDWSRNAGALSCRRGPGFLVILDTRTTIGSAARYTLGEEEAAAYLACESGATFDAIAAELRRTHGIEMGDARLRGLLEEFVGARLMYEERGRYLSLAVQRTS
jgi:ribosomal peptide maturation radical SAM protein 1